MSGVVVGPRGLALPASQPRYPNEQGGIGYAVIFARENPASLPATAAAPIHHAPAIGYEGSAGNLDGVDDTFEPWGTG